MIARWLRRRGLLQHAQTLEAEAARLRRLRYVGPPGPFLPIHETPMQREAAWRRHAECNRQAMERNLETAGRLEAEARRMRREAGT